jgi:hypothetical protein
MIARGEKEGIAKDMEAKDAVVEDGEDVEGEEGRKGAELFLQL